MESPEEPRKDGADLPEPNEPGSDDNMSDEAREQIRRVEHDPTAEPERVGAHPEDDPTAVEPDDGDDDRER